MKNTFLTISILMISILMISFASCKKNTYKCDCKVNGTTRDTTARIFKDVKKSELKSAKRQCNY